MKAFKKLTLVALLLIGSTVAYAQLPAVTLKTIEGKTVNTAKLSNDGKPFVITFFATWFIPCHRELKEYEVLLDSNGDFKRAMGVSTIPALFIIDGNGKIVDRHTGYTDGSEENIIEKIRELLN